MENFIKQNFEIKNVARARIVPANKKAPSKMKRPYYVFIFYHGCEKTYKFKNGKTLHTKSNDILFLPKEEEYVQYNNKKRKGPIESVNAGGKSCSTT